MPIAADNMYYLCDTLGRLLVWSQWVFVLVVATEASTELIVDSKFFEPLRDHIRGIAYPPAAPPPDTPRRRRYAFFSALTGCGYCMSVWTGGFFAIFLPGYTIIPRGPYWHWYTWVLAFYHFGWNMLTWLVYTVLLHRLSNWLHVATELFKRGRVKVHDHTVRVESEER